MKIMFLILIMSCYAIRLNSLCGERQCKICVRVLQLDSTNTLEYLKASSYCLNLLSFNHCCDKFGQSYNSLVPAEDVEKSDSVDERKIFFQIFCGLLVWIVFLAMGSALTLLIFKFL